MTYRRLRNELTVARRVAKREHWRSFVSQSGGRDPFGFVTRSARELVPVETLLSTVRGEGGTQTVCGADCGGNTPQAVSGWYIRR